MDLSLVYIAAVILVIAIGFVFALRMGIAASLEADGVWPESAQEVPAVQDGHAEPAATVAAH